MQWNMIFLALSGKIMFLFPENIILFFRQKMKEDLCGKNILKYDIFCKFPEKVIFPKKLMWNNIFLQLSGKMTFLSPGNMMLFFISLLGTDMFKYIKLLTDISLKVRFSPQNAADSIKTSPTRAAKNIIN